MSECMHLVREGKGVSHESFIAIERISAEEVKQYASAPLSIKYSFAESPFGELLIGSTEKGVCYIGFLTGAREDSLKDMQSRYPYAVIREGSDAYQMRALAFFSRSEIPADPVRLHLHGTDFQMEVWQMLLKIPVGALTTYGEIARQVGRPGASRAVGSAIGDNPVAFLIPCHRVIRSTGGMGGFRWGLPCKARILEWEQMKV